MIFLDKREEPEFWKSYRIKHPKEQYRNLQDSEEGKEVREKLRDYNNKQQYYLCAYCCRRISLNDSLNEHIKPQGNAQYSNHSMDFENIVSSCCNAETCGTAKANKFNEELFVSPLDPTCENHFSYAENGEIFANTEEGKYTISLLNLNSKKLRNARCATYRSYLAYSNKEIANKVFMEVNDRGEKNPFIDMISFFEYSGVRDPGVRG